MVKKLTLSISVVIMTIFFAAQLAAAAGSDYSHLSQAAKHIALNDGFPGMIVSVSQSDGQIAAATTGRTKLHGGTPISANTRFRVASITKTFVATLVIELVDAGKLSLNDTVEHWLPGEVPTGSQITIRELLNHTSGIPDIDSNPKLLLPYRSSRTYFWTPRRLIRLAVSGHRLLSAPAKFSYSNSNYILLGQIVERAGGESVERQLRQRIFKPLGLSATKFELGPRIYGPHAHGYIFPGEPLYQVITRRQSRPVDVSYLSYSWDWTAGAIVSSARDLTKFYRALLQGGLVSPNGLTMMKSTVPVDADTAYGLGLNEIRLPCGETWGHDGEDPGYLSDVLASADGQRVVVFLANSDNHSDRIEKQLLPLAIQALCG